jgi:hypothetical protein
VVDCPSAGGPPSPKPPKEIADGLRLVKAFLKIKDPVLRNGIVEFVERMTREASKNSANAREIISHALTVFD